MFSLQRIMKIHKYSKSKNKTCSCDLAICMRRGDGGGVALQFWAREAGRVATAGRRVGRGGVASNVHVAGTEDGTPLQTLTTIYLPS